MRFANGGRRNFTQTQGSDPATFHQTRQFAHTVFNRYFFIPAVQVIQIDHIGLQALEAVLTIFSDGLWASVNHPLHTIWKTHARHTAFAGQGVALAVWFEHAPHQLFVVTKAIQSGSIKKVDACIQCGEQQAFALFGRRRHPVGITQAHTAQADGADLKRS